MNKGHVLIVDDDTDVLHTARMVLKRHYQQVSTESSPERLTSLMKRESIDVVLLDMNFKAGVTSGNEGLYWLQQVRELCPGACVVMNTAYGDIQLAVECMKRGAVDFLVKPWEKEKLVATVHAVYQLAKSKEKVRQLEGREAALQSTADAGYGQLLTESPAMAAVLQMVEKVAATDASVLILGENGTGKELVAREVHRRSLRNSQSLIKVDLGALPAHLFESELFGHVRGAFTDAREDRAGRFEIADGGTLFLDEIGNISTSLQAKMLSVLQNRTITRLGSSQSVPVDVRLISATNQPLYDLVASGSFREDLLYRVNTVEITLPPLRERPEDILLLAGHFLEGYASRYQKAGLQLDERARNQLVRYSWPGNIRELQHAMERAVIMAEGTVRAEDILPNRKERSTMRHSLKVEDLERDAMVKAIEQSGGNLSRAAEALGIGRTTLYRKMKKYGL